MRIHISFHFNPCSAFFRGSTLYLLPQPCKKAGKIYKYYSIAESYREAGRSQIRIIWRLGRLTDLKAHQIRQVIKIIQSKGAVLLSLEDIIFSKHWLYLDVAVFNHQWENWSLSEVFGRKEDTLKIARILAFNRCLDPGINFMLAVGLEKLALIIS